MNKSYSRVFIHLKVSLVSLVSLVYLVFLVYLVYLVHLVYFVSVNEKRSTKNKEPLIDFLCPVTLAP